MFKKVTLEFTDKADEVSVFIQDSGRQSYASFSFSSSGKAVVGIRRLDHSDKVVEEIATKFITTQNPNIDFNEVITKYPSEKIEFWAKNLDSATLFSVYVHYDQRS